MKVTFALGLAGLACIILSANVDSRSVPGFREWIGLKKKPSAIKEHERLMKEGSEIIHTGIAKKHAVLDHQAKFLQNGQPVVHSSGYHMADVYSNKDYRADIKDMEEHGKLVTAKSEEISKNPNRLRYSPINKEYEEARKLHAAFAKTSNTLKKPVELKSDVKKLKRIMDSERHPTGNPRDTKHIEDERRFVNGIGELVPKPKASHP